MSANELLKPMQSAMERACPEPPEQIDLTFRPMFGGMGVYAHGRIFASLSDVGLALKLAAEHQSALLDNEPEAKRLQYTPDMPPSREYIVIPPAIVDDADRLGAWMERSIDYVKTLPIKKPKSKKAKS